MKDGRRPSSGQAPSRDPPHIYPARSDPPRLAVALAEWCIDSRVRETVVGDLVELYGTASDDAEHGARTRLWFWWQVLIAIARFPPRPRVTPSPGDGLVTGFINDLGRAARTLIRTPAFIALCAVTLGIGIGAATAIFSVADPVILRSLPYASPERLFVVSENDDQGRSSNTGFATYADVALSAKSFDFTAYDVRIITVEHNHTPNRQDLNELLNAKGYRRKFEEFSRWDDWYVKG